MYIGTIFILQVPIVVAVVAAVQGPIKTKTVLHCRHRNTMQRRRWRRVRTVFVRLFLQLRRLLITTITMTSAIWPRCISCRIICICLRTSANEAMRCLRARTCRCCACSTRNRSPPAGTKRSGKQHGPKTTTNSTASRDDSFQE